jgi:integrase
MAGTKPLTNEEQGGVARVLGTFPLRDQTLFTVLIHTGFRVSEALSITVGDQACPGC